MHHDERLPEISPAPPSTLAEWRGAYRSGATPRELLFALQERLTKAQPDPVWIALAGADEIEAQLLRLEARETKAGSRDAVLAAMPLFGVPFAAKDNIDVAGFPTTAACPAYAYRPEQHAAAVARLVEAGAVCVGKTNLDQFATGLVGARSPYGRPSSAFDADRVSGGSSSGSAVAVARGDVPFALGTDTAGSGRVPAGFNNVVGLKPTPGRVGTSGVVPACRSLDCVSIFALTVADAAQVLAVIEGDDPLDGYSTFRPGPQRFARTLRVGVPAAVAFDDAAGYAPAWERALARLADLGHRAVELDFGPLHDVAALLYSGPWVAERYAVVERLLAESPGAVDPTVRKVIEAARGYSATDAFRGQYALRDAAKRAAALWDRVDLLMVPTAPGHPTHAEIDAEPVVANAKLGTYTNFVNLLGWCALALPAGFTESKLPFGVTFIGPGAADAALARFGAGWQAAAALSLGATRREAVGDVATLSPPLPAAEPTLAVAVVGAHLSGLPLNAQLTERGATLRCATTTAPHYRLYALPATAPPKPGLVRVSEGGAAIALEVWELPQAAVGSFLALVAAPLGLGSVELADGSRVHGFLCESHAVTGARDITAHGGWRAWLAAR